MRSVLVVEDDPDLRAVLRMLLDFGGFRVRLTSNGAEALTALEQELPDVILLDLMMPVMDGFTFLLERQKRHVADGVPIVCMSAGGPQMLAQALVLGATDCVHKTDTFFDELCQRLSRYCIDSEIPPLEQT